MASCGVLLYVLGVCVFAGKAHCFVELVCDNQSSGQFDHQSMLNCVIIPTQGTEDVNIQVVFWRNTKIKDPVLVFNSNEIKPKSGYKFAESSWNKTNMNVSLLITSTKVENEGEYTCYVITDSGEARSKTRLSVTAKYDEPKVTLIKKIDIPNADKALICTASGGYPLGQIRWFDNANTEWTKGAKLKVKKMDNGLLELSSKLPLWPASTFPEYTCVVYNSSGQKEHESVIKLDAPDDAKESPTQEYIYEVSDSKASANTSSIVAPILVIGSLIVGLLLALLIYRRRANHPHMKSPTEDPDV
ncbi:cell surface glycoprotein CD200 receptor 4 isoform X2 [Kryptolebias marmoratus]|uniref:cell surface glycoprotein CD200 receptor 4 isoform X2 n=1 Tax=Kryptolebias marmoratus TaxID=37003 RepID=UPI0007F86ABA|nr:cell surface glycoprotein CD200 receptor 4 isoform X2 [Kryptolebias marmoratus]